MSERERVAEALGEAEREYRAAQDALDGSATAAVKYSAARARLDQLFRIAALISATN